MTAQRRISIRAASPVLASINLIALTIVVGAGIGSYVFGVSGSFSQSGGVQVINPTLSLSGDTWMFIASVTNTRDIQVKIVSVTLTGDGGTTRSCLSSGSCFSGTTSFLGKSAGGSLSAQVANTAAAFTAGTFYKARVTFIDGSTVVVIVPSG